MRNLVAALLVWVSAACTGSAQQTLHIRVHPDEKAAFQKGMDGFKLPRQAQWRDTVLVVSSTPVPADSFGRQLLDHLQRGAYLLASLDQWQEQDSLVSAELYLGPAFRWVNVVPGAELDARGLDAAGLRLSALENKPLDYVSVLQMEEKLLSHAENTGYPFARVWLDSVVQAVDGGLTAVLNLQRNAAITFGSVTTLGDVRLPKGFLSQYLGLRAGAPYNKSRLDAVPGRLRALPFLESAGNPLVRFEGGRADIRLPVRKKRAGRFDFVVGLLPQPNDPSGRLLLTGNLSAIFLNALGWGERLSLEFDRLRPETQKIDLQMAVPYVLGSPFGVDGRLNIFRGDTSWVDAQTKLGVQYLFAVGNSVGFFWDNRSIFLQQIDTLTIVQTHQLPPNLDLRQNGFGVEANWLNLDYRFNPRRGWSAYVQGVAGFSTVRRNSQIENLTDPDDPDFDFGALYDSIPENTTRYRPAVALESYLPVFKRSTIKTAVRARGIFSTDPVYNNEQFRLGGNKLMRGFNEESLFATRYAVGTLEYRLLIGPNSYLAAFADYGYIENTTDRQRLFQRPFGLGAGMVFESQAGLFGVSGAVGRNDTGDPFDLRAVKVHLGYVNLF